MQDLMSSFVIGIFGPSGACQNEELPHLTSSDSITSTTSTPTSQASTSSSTTCQSVYLLAKLHRLVQPLNQQSTNQQYHHQSVSHSASQVTQISTKSSQQVRTNLGHLCQTLGQAQTLSG